MQDLLKEARYIKMTFPFDEEMFEEYNYDIEMDEISCLVEGTQWVVTVDLNTHQVTNHQPSTPCVYVYSKARDSGIYTLLDKDNNPLCELRGHVPNGVIPPHDGWGDYIMFTIGTDGFIPDWYDEYDFTKFESEALTREELYAEDCPVLTADNLRFVVEKVAEPLQEKIFTALGSRTREHYSLRSNDMFFSFTYQNDRDESIFSLNEESLKDFMRTKSIWIYYHCGNVRTLGMVSALHVLLPIYLYNDGYELGIIKKKYAYHVLPDEADVNKMLAVSQRQVASLMHASAVTYSFE